MGLTAGEAPWCPRSRRQVKKGPAALCSFSPCFASACAHDFAACKGCQLVHAPGIRSKVLFGLLGAACRASLLTSAACSQRRYSFVDLGQESLPVGGCRWCLAPLHPSRESPPAAGGSLRSRASHWSPALALQMPHGGFRFIACPCPCARCGAAGATRGPGGGTDLCHCSQCNLSCMLPLPSTSHSSLPWLRLSVGDACSLQARVVGGLCFSESDAGVWCAVCVGPVVRARLGGHAGRHLVHVPRGLRPGTAMPSSGGWQRDVPHQ